MFSRIFLLLCVISCELKVDEVFAAPVPEQDLSVRLIFDSDPPRADSVDKDSLDPTKRLAIPNITDHEAEEFLQSLGYNEISSGDLEVTNRFGIDQVLSLIDRIRHFQRDVGLEETGILDDDTKQTMGSPHCGARVSEKRNGDDILKWNKNKLTYRIRDRAAGKNPSVVNSMVKKAFGAWSKVTNLDFVERENPGVDIEINFGGENHQRRGRRCTFENPKTLAHAYFPKDGDVHFNSKYFFLEGEDMDVFLDTAIHEIGHSLGLKHSSMKGSIMHPTEMNRFTEPQPEDVKRIQALYGVRRGTTSPTNNAPRFCSLTKYDAVLDDNDGNWYLFSGNYYYSLKDDNPSGKRISSKWPGITGNIDAAFRYPDGRSYFFKGIWFWRFKGNRLDPKYPRRISEAFPGLPNNVDAIFIDSRRRIIALKGSHGWVYEPATYSVSKFNLNRLGLPSSVDAAVGFGKNITVFKGKSLYRFDKNKLKVNRNKWMTC